MRRLFLPAAMAALFLSSCTGPQYAVPVADPDAVSAERRALLRDAVDTALARRGRVYDLAWPVLTQNTELCPETAPSIGVVLADREMLGRLAGGVREEDLDEIGYDEELVIAHVMAGSPAAEAGLAAGDVLVSVDEDDASKPGAAAKAIRAALEEDGAAALSVERAGVTKAITVTPVTACDLKVKVSTSQSLNAHALTGDIVIFTGSIRSLSDDGLQFLIAHEAAHLILGHKAKYLRNLGVSGGFLSVPLFYSAGRAADAGLGLAGQRLDTPLSARALRATIPWTERFEAEADYVGLYLFARAGGDIARARELFSVFGREAPGSIYARSTHPLPPERLARAEWTVAEIEAKRAAGAPILPDEADR